ncbi:shikimate kinase [Bryobacterales bacterium F-183]|nr:shikimate kinase [Bryobacterales bacterium F-183]
MILKLKRTPGLYLTGFMGSGKTTIGERLADELGWSFVDMDADIVSSQGTSIADIFDTGGEEAFRSIETECLRKRVRMIQSGRPMVVALGGGAFAQEANIRLLQDNGIAVWLDAPLELIRRRLEGATDRPLARDPERFEQLYNTRREAYSKADYRVEIRNNDPMDAVRQILELPLFTP